MVADYWIPWLSQHQWLPAAFTYGEHDHIVPPWASLVIIFGLLGISMLASVIAEKRNPSSENKKDKQTPAHDPAASSEKNSPPEASASAESTPGKDP